MTIDIETTQFSTVIIGEALKTDIDMINVVFSNMLAQSHTSLYDYIAIQKKEAIKLAIRRTRGLLSQREVRDILKLYK